MGFSRALLLVFIWTRILASDAKCPLQARIVSTQDFKVTFEVTNQEKSNSICALKWNSVMDNDFWPVNVDTYQSKRVINNFKKMQAKHLENSSLWEEATIPYTKPIMPLRSKIESSDYQLFKPGQSISFTRDLTEVYSFIKGRIYSIEIQPAIYDCYILTTCNTPCTANIAKHWTAGSVGTQVLSYFQAEKGYSSQQMTFSDWIMKTKNNPIWNVHTHGTGPDTVIVEQVANMQQTCPQVVSEAHTNAVKYVQEATAYLKNFKASKLFKSWFGECGDYNIVLKNFIETEKGLSKPHTYNILPENLCGEHVLASTPMPGKEQHFFYICPLFFKDNKRKTKKANEEERAITITHELTHDAVDTQDIGSKCYGPRNCKQMARKTPGQAIWNADNYALFAHAVHQAKNVSPKCSGKKRKNTNNKSQNNSPKRRKKIKKPPLEALLMHFLAQKLLE